MSQIIRYGCSVGIMALVLTIAPIVGAQIVPDNTLPTNSRVSPGCQICTVTGGTERGVNLYHSFREFSIPTGGAAYFDNGLQIQNILTRVTGNSISNIDGLIRTNGSANLFLLNPQGIVFGPNARLQIGGSFGATTANSFKFLDGHEFSAIDPQAPPLLRVNMPLGLQYGPGQAPIDHLGTLVVGNGQNLTLLGSDVTSRGTLIAPGGQVEILGDRVALLANAQVDVSSSKGGGTVLIGGDYKGQGTVPNALQTYVAPSATINADATSTGKGGKVIVWADDTTGFYGNIRARGGVQAGNGGFVEVSGAKHLTFNGLVNTSAPSGKSGTLLLDPTNITVVPGNTPNPPNAADGVWGATEDSGNQTIGANAIATLLNANSLTLQATDTILLENADLTLNSANTLTLKAGTINLLRASIEQTGGGNITLDATNAITIDGINDSIIPEYTFKEVKVLGFPLTEVTGLKLARSGVFNTVLPTSLVNGGNINIRTGRLNVVNGALISASTEGIGNAGSVTIFADTTVFNGVRKSLVNNQELPLPPDVTLTSEQINQRLNALIAKANNSTKFQVPGGVLTLVLPEAKGNGGEVSVTTQTLSITGGAQLSTVTFGQGNPGNVVVNANKTAAFAGVAVAPTLTLNGTQVVGVFLTGPLPNSSIPFNIRSNPEIPLTPSGASASVRAGANVTNTTRGSVTINSPQLEVREGARITASTAAQGDAGNVTIKANSVILSGAGPNAKSPGEARANEFPGGISVLTQSQTDSTGKLIKGNGGNINIDTQTLQVSDGIVIAALTRGNGKAGNVRINATDSASFDRSFVLSEVQTGGVGSGGDIDLATSALSLRNGAQFRASTSGQGDAGNVIVRNAKTVALTTNSSISTAANAGAIGKGGNVSIQTGLFSIDRNAQIIASTAAQNQKAGDVTIDANIFDASSQGQILTTTSSNGKAGNITLNVADRVTLTDPQTAILANTARGSSGNGGTITIASRLIEIKNGARIAVDSQGSGEGGNIAINGGQMTLSKGAVTAQSASAQGGNIALDLKDVILLRRNSVISATAGTDLAGGNGGNVTIKTPFLLGVLAENSDITANAFRGNGGNITITANQVFGLLPQPQNTRFSDITASSALGINGNVILNTLNIDPSRGLQDLNLIPVDPSNLVAQTCNSNRPVVEGESRFVIVGRGGLSASPDDPFGGTAILNDLGHSVVSATTSAVIPQSAATAPTSIVEAQSLIQGRDGALYLVTLASPDVLPISSQPLQGRSCH